jgi:hypothetical protein
MPSIQFNCLIVMMSESVTGTIYLGLKALSRFVIWKRYRGWSVSFSLVPRVASQHCYVLSVYETHAPCLGPRVPQVYFYVTACFYVECRSNDLAIQPNLVVPGHMKSIHLQKETEYRCQETVTFLTPRSQCPEPRHPHKSELIVNI